MDLNPIEIIYHYTTDKWGFINSPKIVYGVTRKKIQNLEDRVFIANYFDGVGYVTPTLQRDNLTWSSQSIVTWEQDHTLIGMITGRRFLRIQFKPIEQMKVFQSLDHLNIEMIMRATAEGIVHPSELPNKVACSRVMVPPGLEGQEPFVVLANPLEMIELFGTRPTGERFHSEFFRSFYF